MTDAVGAVDQAQDPFFSANGNEGLEGDADARQRGDDIKDCHAGSLARSARSGNGGAKEVDISSCRQRIGGCDLAAGNEAGGLADVRDGAAAGTVDSVEMEDLVGPVLVPEDVAQHGVYARGGIRDEDAGVDVDI